MPRPSAPRLVKHLVIGLCAGAHVLAQAEGTWFNIQGDASNPGTDTIEVDPVPVSVNAEFRTMRVRVSRADVRSNWEGVPYRSYNSEVLFDCVQLTARYTVVEYFMQPAWKGIAHVTVHYAGDEPRPMQFRDVNPNPTARILRAACQRPAPTGN